VRDEVFVISQTVRVAELAKKMECRATIGGTPEIFPAFPSHWPPRAISHGEREPLPADNLPVRQPQ
jgi:hypothetical protein